ncbi:MAG TPA: agmatinase [Candidatus Deferrimicrobium sp.]|nr:agmatinase [Candidatus Deferrimicrobium sp.]
MFDSLVERFTGFMGATEDYEEADIALVGIPMDFTVSFRPGTRMGPQQIRTVSYGIEEYSVYLNRDLADKSYFDLGDMNLPFGNVEGSLTVIQDVTRRLLSDKKFPILLGGEHLVTYPIIKAFKEQYQDLVVIHFDAHADLRLDYAGEPNSHATVMRKVAQMIEPKNLYQFGIRSGTRDEFQYAKENTNMFIDRVIEPLKQVIPTLGQRPVYVSLDIDVVDPAYAPGTGTPEAGGCSSREIIEAIHELGAANVVGFDLVEVSPATDQSERTSLLAAKIIREAILSFC